MDLVNFCMCVHNFRPSWICRRWHRFYIQIDLLCITQSAYLVLRCSFNDFSLWTRSWRYNVKSISSLFVYLCKTPCLGIVGWLFKLSFWAPLSRLNFGAFIVGPFVVLYTYATSETVLHFTSYNMVSVFLNIIYCFYDNCHKISCFIF